MAPTERELARRLQRSQWFATGLLAAMAVVFVISGLNRDAYPGLDLIWAFSEAALIGGLADWFAVTALFRRPLGLPIPHTGVVPKRKNEIGRAMARFVGEHFLVRDAVERRLTGVNLAERLGAWLERPDNARRLTRDFSVAMDWLLRSVDSSELRDGVKTSLKDALDRIPPNAALAAVLDVLAAGRHSQALIDQLIQFGRDQLDANKAHIRARIQERSPWWLPRFVDETIYDQLVSELERILSEVGDDPAHPARSQFNERLRHLRFALANDPDLMGKGERIRDELFTHPAIAAFVSDALERVRAFLHEAFSDAGSPLRLGIERELRGIGGTIRADRELQARLNRWLSASIVYLVETYREPLSEVISDTVDRWDATETSRRIELHIGKDLQFIRVNGTLVGGFVGVLLYLLWQAIAS